jgi:hypothetical protein
MLRRFAIAAILLTVGAMAVQARTSVSGTWTFTCVGNRFQGTITLQQSGPTVMGWWRTEVGKSEPDTSVSGEIRGNTIYLTRSIGNLQQKYVLTISPDGNKIYGYGDGWGINHADMNMERSGSAEPVQTPESAIGPGPKNLEWKWAVQSVAQRRGSDVKYANYSYESKTNKVVNEMLSLPDGAVIANVVPDCAFYLQDSKGNYTKFQNAREAVGTAVRSGYWTVYPINADGVMVYFK